jgi:hypothetical protein
MTKQLDRIFVFIFALFLLSCSCMSQPIQKDRTGEELFQAVVLNPIPNSVVLLHSNDEVPLFDPSVWLHFTISSDEFDKILSTENWEIDKSGYDGTYNTPVEEWWHPEKMKNVTKYHVKLIDSNAWKNIWVNEDRTEVYFREDF